MTRAGLACSGPAAYRTTARRRVRRGSLETQAPTPRPHPWSDTARGPACNGRAAWRRTARRRTPRDRGAVPGPQGGLETEVSRSRRCRRDRCHIPSPSRPRRLRDRNHIRGLRQGVDGRRRGVQLVDGGGTVEVDVVAEAAATARPPPPTPLRRPVHAANRYT